jgi:nitric oxide reductase subunit C
MIRVAIFCLLIVLFFGYSFLVYTKGTKSNLSFTRIEQQKINHGKQLFQQYNCQACHQIYGLGGYLGPELTTAYSDKSRGEQYMRAMLSAEGNRMPDFHLNTKQIDALIAYLKYVDTTATPVPPANRQ